MEYETVTQQEFEAVFHRSRGVSRPLTPETRALTLLEPLRGMKVRCRWKHTPACGGATVLRDYARRHGFKAKFSCHAGYLYAFRYE